MSKPSDVLYDARWVGKHGIGRFADELQQRLPYVTPFGASRRPWHPMDPAFLGAALWTIRPRVFFSPGYNSPIGWPHPFVFTLHDLHHLRVPADSSRAKRAYYKYVIRPACHKAVAVLTVSDFSRSEILEWSGLAPDRVIVVGCAVGPPFGSCGDKYAPGYPYLLYVGSRKPHKNLPRLLQAFAISGTQKGVRLILSGHADAQLLREIARLGLEKAVEFADVCDDTDLARLYRGGVGLLFPSLYEGFGLPPLEAMACGLPVLTSNVCSLPEVAGDAAILVEPLDVEAIAGGICRLVDDRELRARLIQNGLQQAARYSWDETARKTWQVLQQAARAN